MNSRRMLQAGIVVLMMVGMFLGGVLPALAQPSPIFRDGFESGDASAWSRVVIHGPDETPPTLTVIAPGEDALIFNDETPQILVAYFDAVAGVEPGSFHLQLDGMDVTAACTAGPTTAVCEPPALGGGLHTLVARIQDLAKNEGMAQREFELRFDATPPEITILSPTDGALLSSSGVLVSGLVTDDDQVAAVTIDGETGSLDGDAFEAVAALAQGTNALVVTATDRAGNQAQATVNVVLDALPPRLVVQTPAPGEETNAATVAFSGTVEDDLGVAGVTLDGVPVDVVGGRFSQEVAVAEGESTVLVRADDVAGNFAEVPVSVSRRSLPEITITSPADAAIVQADHVDVQGTVSANTVAVTVGGVAAALDGGKFTAPDVPVDGGGNLLVAVATTVAGSLATDKVTVFRDFSAPRVVIYEPVDGASLNTAEIPVTGLVNDTVFGTVNSGQVTVRVNGLEATVANRAFLLPALALVPGENLITVEAEDASGNLGTATATVFFEPPVGPSIRKVSGDLQQGLVGSILPQPLVVELRDGAGDPVSDRPVVFQVVGNNGSLDGGRRRLAVTSGADGRAAATFTLGTRAGAGVQQVLVTAPGFLGRPLFLASATAGPAGRLHLDDGDQQVGTAGQLLPDSLAVVVTDAFFNRLEGVPVRFRVAGGGGSFPSGSQEFTVASDSDGRALASLRLDAAEGIANNVVEVDLPGAPAVPFVAFTASGWMAGDPAATAVSGIVVDNSNVAVPGVTVHIRGTPLEAQTDEQGVFRIAPAPVGTFFLEIDGATTTRPGTWPHLEFQMTTVAGRDNTLGMPIFLLPIDEARGLAVDEATGGVLTLPELPGFALEVAPGSVTFPGGGRSGVVSVTLVHGDKVPMVPNFGQQPTFIITIQPAGALFDPPARISLPNAEAMAPGEVTEFYSFDHDLVSFVSIGPGTVSEDGLRIVSNPGVGILEAGWHCGGNPSSSGTPHDCPGCKICNGSRCVPGCALPVEERFGSAEPDFLAALAAGALGCPNCTGNDPCRFNYRCENGTCVSDEVKVNGITGGACVAAVGQSLSFMAQSNKADQVKWRAAGGTPDMGTGASFSVSFASEGDKTVTAFCTDSKNKMVTVGPTCAGIMATLMEPETAGSAGSNFGSVSPGVAKMATYKPCVDSSMWCFRLESYSETHSFAVNGQGRTNVASAMDPVVTAGTCAAIIADLTPPGAGATNGPPRRTYWSQAFTTAHERAHVTNISSLITQKVFADLQAFVRNGSNCTTCKSATPTSRFNAEMNRLFTMHLRAMASSEEARAHGVSNPMYSALIQAIRTRGQAEGWPAACQ